MTLYYEDVFEIYVSMFGKIIFNVLCVSSVHYSAYGRRYLYWLRLGDVVVYWSEDIILAYGSGDVGAYGSNTTI